MYTAYMDPHIDFLSAIILFGIVQGILILILFFLKKPKGYIFFSVLIGIFILQQVESLLYYSGYLLYVPHLYYTSLPLVFLCGPAIIGYRNAVWGRNTSKGTILWHSVPFVLYTLYTLFFYLQSGAKKIHTYMLSIEGTTDLPKPSQAFDADPLEIHGFVFVEGIALYLIGYGLFLVIGLHKRMKKEKGNSYTSWLKVLYAILLGSGLVMLMAEGGIIEGVSLYEPILPQYMTRVYVTLSMYIITAYLLFHTKLYRQEKKYQKSALSKSIRAAKLQKIMEVFEKDKSYLDQEHCLSQLSQQTNISESHISEVLNQELKLSFYELTNTFRIKEAKRLLADDAKPMKMEQLAYALGYKSKSTFFAAFKKESRQTPLQYKKALQNLKKP
ncbi:helix-turn-helix domain-containing protein [Spongiimicrobium salis]|uniref:helix-turn-helix domain-containing protein n=1 Tax=Spongiimicrobium salis TaxID=1667022 RepID=UPI00374D5EB4